MTRVLLVVALLVVACGGEPAAVEYRWEYETAEGQVLLESDGAPSEQRWLSDLLSAAPQQFALQPIEPREYNGAQEVDWIHSNAVVCIQFE